MGFLRELFQQIIRLFNWFVIVTPWEQAVRVRLGKWVRVLHAGIHLRIPFVDRLYRQSIRRRIALIPTQTLTTRDGRTVTLGGAVGYAITDLRRLYDTLYDAEDTIVSEVMGAVTQYLINHKLDECQPHLVQDYVAEALDLSRYGLGDQEFFLTDFAVVRTFRLIQGGGRDYKHGMTLSTDNEERDPSYL